MIQQQQLTAGGTLALLIRLSLPLGTRSAWGGHHGLILLLFFQAWLSDIHVQQFSYATNSLSDNSDRLKGTGVPLAGSLNRTYKTCQFTNPCCLAVLPSSSCTKDTMPPRDVSFLHSSKSLSEVTSGSATSSPPCNAGTEEVANCFKAERASALMSGSVAVSGVVRKMAVL